MIKVDFTIDDPALEADIAQAQVDSKLAGIPPDEFLVNAARSGFEQFRGARKRSIAGVVQHFIDLVNSADAGQTQALADVLQYVEGKLESLQPKV